MSKKIEMIVVVLAAVLLVGAIGLSMARDYRGDFMERSTANTEDTRSDGDCTGDSKLKILDRVNLTDEQEQEIRDTVISMREEGADRTEIRDTVRNMVEDYGADLPEPKGDMHRFRGRMRQGRGGRHQRGECP
ncbi:MAG: hypothetical protein ACQEQM_04825 [Thermoplasmatota archaeon]